MPAKHVIIPIFVPHKGCPHDCIFCNQKKISGQIEEMTVDRVPQIIESHLQTIKQDAFVEIAFYGGSFTAIEKSVQKSFLEKANIYLSNGSISEIRLSTRPDYIDDDILDFLMQYGVRTIELGVQSLDDDVLKSSCRGHDAACVYKAASLIKKKGLRLGIQTMTGLPKDTQEKCLYTAQQVISISPEIVRIYPVLVIKGTFLEELYTKGLYKPQGLNEAVDLCAKLMKLYEDNGIKVIRIGLQTSDSISEGPDSQVAAGPLHPAFRQLVESKLMMEQIENAIEKNNLMGKKEIIIKTGKSNISNVIGIKRSNINIIKDKYCISSVTVSADKSLSREIICMAPDI